MSYRIISNVLESSADESSSGTIQTANIEQPGVAGDLLIFEPNAGSTNTIQQSNKPPGFGSDSPMFESNSNDETMRLYGMPHRGVEPVEPDLAAAEFLFPAEDLCPSNPLSLPKVLLPHPAIVPPPGVSYPQAELYSLKMTSAYRRGCVYIAPFDPSSKSEVHDCLLRLQTPPKATPRLSNGQFIADPIPGMIQALPGISFANTIGGDENKMVTICSFHTLDSLDDYEDGRKVRGWAEDLRKIIFGSPPRNGSPGRKPIYAANLKKNMRSGSATSAQYMGSYSLAATKGEGEGEGVGIPAKQNIALEDERNIAEALRLLAKINQVVLSCSISRFEETMIQFNNEDNNVFSFGGLFSGHMGCQMNVSFGVEALSKLIGRLQSSWHPDVNDCQARFTVFTLMFRLPPGSDPGPFMLGRHGIYVRELNQCIIFIVFKGNDLHSGFHPSYTAEAKEAWLKAVDDMWESSVERIGLVSYPNRSISSRTAGMSISPPLHFGNHGEPIARHHAQLNFSQHSRGILGKAEDHYTRLGREAIWSFANLLAQSGLSWEGDIDDLYRRVKYVDEDKVPHHISVPRYDIHKNPGLVWKMRGYWQWYETYLVLPYYIRWTKVGYRSQQERISCTRQADAFSAMEISSIALPLRQSVLQETSPNPISIPNIEKILHRAREDGETLWSVMVNDDGVAVPKKIADSEFKIFKSRSATLARLELDYMNKNFPSSLKDIIGMQVQSENCDIPMDIDSPGGSRAPAIEISARSPSVHISGPNPSPTTTTPDAMEMPSGCGSQNKNRERNEMLPTPISSSIPDLNDNNNTEEIGNNILMDVDPPGGLPAATMEVPFQYPPLHNSTADQSPTAISPDAMERSSGCGSSEKNGNGKVTPPSSTSPSHFDSNDDMEVPPRYPPICSSRSDRFRTGAFPDEMETLSGRGSSEKNGKQKEPPPSPTSPSDGDSDDHLEAPPRYPLIRSSRSDQFPTATSPDAMEVHPGSGSSEKNKKQKETSPGPTSPSGGDSNDHMENSPESPPIRNSTADRFPTTAPADAMDRLSGHGSLEQNGKQKETLISRSSSDHESDDDNVYEVEKIVGFKCDDGMPSWCVKWKGYSDDQSSWLPKSSLGGCWNKVLKFCYLHPELVDQKYFQEDEDGESSGDDYAPPEDTSAKKRKKHSQKQMPQPPQKRTRTDAQAVDAFAADPDSIAMRALRNLLNEQGLRDDLTTLQNGTHVLNHKIGYKLPNLTHMVTGIIKRQKENNFINNALKLVDASLLDIPSSGIQHASPFLMFYRLQEAVSALPSLLIGTHQLHLIKRAAMMDSCRCLIIIYDWYFQSGPFINSRMFGLYFSGTDGPTRLQGLYPTFAPAVTQVVDFIRTFMALNGRFIDTPSPATVVTRLTEEDEICSAQKKLKALQKMPENFHGLLTGSTSRIILLREPSGEVRTTRNYLQEKCKECFLEALSQQLVAYPMTKLDEQFTRSTVKHNRDPDAIKGRCLARAVILHTISRVCGTEAIFASQHIQGILYSPTQLFSSWAPHLTKRERFISALLAKKASDETLAPLIDFITPMITPSLISAANDLGAFVHRETLGLAKGSSISEESYLNSECENAQYAIPKAVSGKGCAMDRYKPTLPLSKVDRAEIWPHAEPLRLGKMAIILQEVLNKCRGLPGVQAEISNVARGLEPSGTSKADDDFLNPIRGDNFSTRLIREKFAGHPLTSDLGLSNLMVWMGSGQGYGTQRFAQAGPMFFHSLDSCTLRFENAIAHNRDLLSQLAVKGKISCFEKHESYMAFDNQRFYSTANHNLAVIQTVRNTTTSDSEKEYHSVRHKFEPYFSLAVRSAWVSFLGGLAGQELSSISPEDLKAWLDTVVFIEGLGVSGFGSGLTPFQTVNMLAILGLCKMPTPEEMAIWISIHPNKGAWLQLVDLGFTGHNSRTMQAAFLAYHRFLDEHLSSSDKALLHFSPMFSEHFLCKTKRWTWYLKDHGFDLTVYALNIQSRDGGDWVQDANSIDGKQFPIPLQWSIASLDAFCDSLP